MKRLFVAFLTLGSVSQAHAAGSADVAATFTGLTEVKMLPVDRSVINQELTYTRLTLDGLPLSSRAAALCQPATLRMGGLEDGGTAGYEQFKNDPVKRGWTVQAERELDDPEMELRAVRWTRAEGGGRAMLALWMHEGASGEEGAESPAEDSFTGAIFCEERPGWQAEPPKAPLAQAPRLPAKFSFQTRPDGAPAQSVRPVYSLLGRGGEVGYLDAAGVATLNLPAPPAEVLRPIAEWTKVFGDPCYGIKQATISNPAVKFAVVEKLIPASRNVSSGAFYLLSRQEGRGGQLVNRPLVYTSGPVKLQLDTVCPGMGDHYQVNLNLPGGWTFVQLESHFPEFQPGLVTLTNPPSNRLVWE